MSEEFKYYNDYIRMTKFYVRNINYFRVALDNLRMRSREFSEELNGYEDIPSPVVAYKERTSKGAAELTNVEAATEKRLSKTAQLKRIEYEIVRLEGFMSRMERALSRLPDEDKKLLQDFVIDRRNADAVAYNLHLSRRTLFRKRDEIMEKMALMLFGPKAAPDNRSFVFAE